MDGVVGETVAIIAVGMVIPWKERSPAMKYGGAALAVAGAALALFWPDGPEVSAEPTVGGARAAVSVGF